MTKHWIHEWVDRIKTAPTPRISPIASSKPLDLERAQERYFMRLKLESGALPCARCGYKGPGVELELGAADPTRLIPLCRLCENDDRRGEQ